MCFTKTENDIVCVPGFGFGLRSHNGINFFWVQQIGVVELIDAGKIVAYFRLFSDFYRHWHTKIGHPVQCERTNPRLRFLARHSTRFHRVAKDALVALHRQFHIAAEIVAGHLLPGGAPFLGDGFNMLVPPSRAGGGKQSALTPCVRIEVLSH